MKRRRVSGRILLFALLTTLAGSLFASVLAQDDGAPRFRSRSEQVSEQRKLKQAFPELVRALRTLHLSPDKMNQVATKLRRSEDATRSARQELQLLDEENE